MPEEQRLKIAESLTGIQRSEETRAKISESLKGQVQTEEHRMKLALAAKKRWARARGEDPDLITMADIDLSAPKKKNRSGTSARPRLPVRDLEVTLPDGRIATASPRSEIAPVMERVKLILSLDGSPSQRDWDALEAWVNRPRPRAKAKGPTFIDCQCFAGAFTLGATQAGFTLIHKAEDTGGFGIPMCEANRGLLGDCWESQESVPPLWEVPEGTVDLVIGNPPCSGFSVMSPKSFRGMDSDINQCMRNLFAYAERAKPKAVVMESVPSAYKIGLPLMRDLAETFPGWHVTHVIQDNYSLGGCTKRRRYFLVVTAFPFGVEPEPLKWLPSTGDAIGDLVRQPLSWEAQPYNKAPTWWSHRQRSATGLVDGHATPELSAASQKRLNDIVRGDENGHSVDWPPGFTHDMVLKLFYETHGYLPESWQYQSMARDTRHLTRDKVMIDKNFDMGGYAQTRHWPWDEPGYVITGHGPAQAWHKNSRHFTHRETARVMGFPDDWKIAPLKDVPQLGAMWGKGISVDCGRWVCTWVMNSMKGNPGSMRGDLLPDGIDRLIDVSQLWKQAPMGLPAPESAHQP